LRMRPDLGVRISVREAGSNRPLRKLVVSEKIDARNGTNLQLHLDDEGVGYLPSALAGSVLSFLAFGYVPAVVHEWDGAKLDLRLEPEEVE